MNIHFPCSIFYSRYLTRREKIRRLQGKLLQEIGASQRNGINGADEADDLRISPVMACWKWPVMKKSQLKYVEIC